MARTAAWPSLDFCQSLLETYAVNDRINQLILENLDPHAWRAKPPGRNVRTIASIFAHMHNVRRKWLRLSAPHQPAEAPRSPALHATTGRHGARGKCPALFGNDRGSPGPPRGSRQAIPPKRLGQALAQERRHGCLHGPA